MEAKTKRRKQQNLKKGRLSQEGREIEKELQGRRGVERE